MPSEPSEKKFWGLSLALASATIYDVETTFAGLGNCRDCAEANPIMRPFVKNGRPATYAFTMGVSGAEIYFARKLRKRHSKLWWLPLAAGTATHVVAGSANLRFVFK